MGSRQVVYFTSTQRNLKEASEDALGGLVLRVCEPVKAKIYNLSATHAFLISVIPLLSTVVQFYE